MKKNSKALALGFVATLICSCFSPAFANNPSFDPNCYDPAKVGTVGLAGWIGCEGKLIVDRTTLDAVIASNDIYSAASDTWNVSEVFTGQIADMSRVFRLNDFINDAPEWDISGWDTSNATTIQYMFAYADNFNQDISAWDVSNVTDMKGAFLAATTFNQDISAWDVSSVTTFDGTFNSATAFNGPLNNWDVGSATTIANMFRLAQSFNQPLNGWNTSNITDMSGAFDRAYAFN